MNANDWWLNVVVVMLFVVVSSLLFKEHKPSTYLQKSFITSFVHYLLHIEYFQEWCEGYSFVRINQEAQFWSCGMRVNEQLWWQLVQWWRVWRLDYWLLVGNNVERIQSAEWWIRGGRVELIEGHIALGNVHYAQVSKSGLFVSPFVEILEYC